MKSASNAQPRPRVSVVIPAIAGASLARAVHVLREQTLADWRAVIVGAAASAETRRLIGGDERFAFAPANGPAHEAINAGLGACTGEFTTVLDARDFLVPEALERLTSAAREAKLDGAYGGYVFHGPLGVLPTDPLTGRPRTSAGPTGELGIEHLGECKLMPLHAMVIRSELLEGVGVRLPIELGGDHDLLLQLARRGARWAGCGSCVGAVAMEEPGEAGTIMRALASHAMVLASGRAGGGGEDATADRRRVLHSHAEAAVLLSAFGRELEQLVEPEDRARAFLGRTEFGNLFAQWWARLRFLGRPPRHVLAASGSIERWAQSSARQIAERVVAACGSGRPIVLLGLGRNARELCRVLVRRGEAIVGRDDGLTAAPGWAREDGVAVRVLGREDPWDPEAQHVMTLARDEEYLARLPRGLRIIRWAEAPGLLAAEAMALAADRLAEGRTDVRSEGASPAGGAGLGGLAAGALAGAAS